MSKLFIKRESPAINSDRHWMRQALTIARTAPPVDVPVGAVLISGEQCIAQAANRRERDQNPVGHAEIVLLAEAGNKLNNWRLTGTTLYVTLEPCPMCASAIAQARVSRLVFGAYDPLYGACGSRWNLLPGETEVVGGILETSCKELLEDFFKGIQIARKDSSI